MSVWGLVRTNHTVALMEADSGIVQYNADSLFIRGSYGDNKNFGTRGRPGYGRNFAGIGLCAYSTQTGHLFRHKLDSHSSANWTPVPCQTGHLFHVKLDTLGVTARG